MGDATKSSLLVQEVMEMEWSALRSANQRLPSLWKKDSISDVRLFQTSHSHLNLLCYLFFLLLILQMYSEMQEHDELAVLEEIQQELITQGFRQYLNLHVYVCYLGTWHLKET